MAISQQYLSEVLEKYEAKVSQAWKDAFEAFKKEQKADALLVDVWEKRISEAISAMNSAVERRGTKLENCKWVFQFMISAVGLAAVLGGIFGLIQYRDLSTLSAKLEVQNKTVRDIVSRMDLNNRQAAKQHVENLFDQIYPDLDETMESLSPVEPSEELLQHRRLIIRDSESVARAKEELTNARSGEALALEIEEQSTANSPNNTSNETSESKELDAQLELAKKELGLIGDALPLVEEATDFIMAGDEATNRALDQLEERWESLESRTKEFPIKSPREARLEAYCHESLGVIHFRRFIRSQSEEDLNKADQYLEDALSEDAHLATANANEAGVQLALFELHWGSLNPTTSAVEDAKKAEAELEQIVNLIQVAVDDAPTEWEKAVFRTNLVSALSKRAIFLWEWRDAKAALRGTYNDDIVRAEKEARVARRSPNAPAGLFVLSAGIVSLQLQYEDATDKAARAKQRWQEISNLFLEAKQRGWSAQSVSDLMKQFPQFKYIKVLGNSKDFEFDELLK